MLLLTTTLLAVPLPLVQSLDHHPDRCGTATPPRGAALEGLRGSAPRARWVIQENRRAGTNAWCISPQAPTNIQGYSDHVSAQRGNVVTLFVSAAAPLFYVEGYRLGFYEGLGARLVWSSGEVAGQSQPAPRHDPGTNLVEADWDPSMRFRVTSDWPPGAYLLKLVGSDGSQAYVPLVIRDDRSRAALLIQLGVVTWQAYNDWGGYNLYHGPGNWREDPARPRLTRARIVSFDRPYAAERGAGSLDEEQPLVSLVEQLGLDVTYGTDIDLDEHPAMLLRHHALVVPGHDEYWSTRMLNGALAARDHGVNIALLSANDIYRHVRFQPSPFGIDRRVICYKAAWEDPMLGRVNSEVTVEFRNPPLLQPESALNGALYECNPVHADMVVSDADNWLFDGTGLRPGEHVPGVIGGEYDRVTPTVPTPATIEVLAHSPLVCWGHPSFADMTYYTSRSRSGVFDAATTSWLTDLTLQCALGRHCGRLSLIIERMTENLLAVFGRGPAGIEHPSQSNLNSLGVTLSQPIWP